MSTSLCSTRQPFYQSGGGRATGGDSTQRNSGLAEQGLSEWSQAKSCAHQHRLPLLGEQHWTAAVSNEPSLVSSHPLHLPGDFLCASSGELHKAVTRYPVLPCSRAKELPGSMSCHPAFNPQQFFFTAPCPPRCSTDHHSHCRKGLRRRRAGSQRGQRAPAGRCSCSSSVPASRDAGGRRAHVCGRAGSGAGTAGAAGKRAIAPPQLGASRQ